MANFLKNWKTPFAGLGLVAAGSLFFQRPATTSSPKEGEQYTVVVGPEGDPLPVQESGEHLIWFENFLSNPVMVAALPQDMSGEFHKIPGQNKMAAMAADGSALLEVEFVKTDENMGGVYSLSTYSLDEENIAALAAKVGNAGLDIGMLYRDCGAELEAAKKLNSIDGKPASINFQENGDGLFYASVEIWAKDGILFREDGLPSRVDHYSAGFQREYYKTDRDYAAIGQQLRDAEGTVRLQYLLEKNGMPSEVRFNDDDAIAMFERYFGPLPSHILMISGLVNSAEASQNLDNNSAERQTEMLQALRERTYQR